MLALEVCVHGGLAGAEDQRLVRRGGARPALRKSFRPPGDPPVLVPDVEERRLAVYPAVAEATASN